MAATPSVPEMINQKLEAFERLQAEFEVCFQFVQHVHGQLRFTSFPVADSVRYLNALWVCECKDRLLGVYKNIRRYDGHYCLELLQHWQEGDTAGVVGFLNRKLDMLPYADLTRQIQEARYQHKNDGLARRLEHGRLVLLNREMNLVQALDEIFTLPEDTLIKEVQVVCARFGHDPSRIEKQLAEMETPLYAYVAHQALAQRNMILMNKLGVTAMGLPTDRPGERSWRVLEPTVPLRPFAEQVVEGYVGLTLPGHNNITRLRFIDFPERTIISPR